MEEADNQEQTNGGAQESTRDIDELIDSLFARKPQDVIDRIIEIFFRHIEPAIPLLYEDIRKAGPHVIACKDIYSTLCSLYISRSLLSLAKEQTCIAEEQTKIAERQEAIAKRIEQGSDRTMKLTRRITALSYVLVAVGIITFVAVCVQIAIEKHWL